MKKRNVIFPLASLAVLVHTQCAMADYFSPNNPLSYSDGQAHTMTDNDYFDFNNNTNNTTALSVSGSGTSVTGAKTRISGTSTGATMVIVSDGGALTLNNSSLSLGGGASNTGLAVSNGSLALNNDNLIIADTRNDFGIQSSEGTVALSGTNITVSALDSTGIYAVQNSVLTTTGGTIKMTNSADTGINIATSKAELKGTTVQTTGKDSNAIDAEDASDVVGDGLTLNTQSDASLGIYATGGSNLALANSKITTSGSASDAIDMDQSNAVLDNDTIGVTGDATNGISAVDESRLDISNGSISTAGYNSAALYVDNSNAQLHSQTITTTGEMSDGVQAGNGASVTLANSNVETDGSESHAVDFISDQGDVNSVDSSLTSKNGSAVNNTRGSNNFELSDFSSVNAKGATAVSVASGDLDLSSYQSLIQGNMETSGDGELDAYLNNHSVWSGTSTGNVNVSLDESLWNVTGDSSVSSLNNGGTIVFADTTNTLPTADYTSTLTVTGNYTGDNGLLVTNADTEAGTANQMIVQGNATGNTNVAIGKVAATEGDQGYIPVVTVDGDASGATFNQVGRASVGGYEYQLHNTQNNGQSVWYLSDKTDATAPPTGGGGDGDGDGNGSGNDQTPPPSGSGGTRIVAPETAAYQANNLMAYRMLFDTWHDRTGSQFAPGDDGKGVFLRTNGGHQSFHSSDDQLKTDTDMMTFELGAQLGKKAIGDGSIVWGVTGSYGHGNSTSHSSITGYEADGITDGYSGGLYATWLQHNDDNHGAYVDTWAKYGNFQSSVKGDDMGEVTYHTNGWAASLESGYTFEAWHGTKGSLYIQPQAQLAWLGLNMKDHQDGLGNTVSSTDNGDLVSRLGARVYWDSTNKEHNFRPYMQFDYINNSSNGGVTYKSTMGETSFSPEGVTNIGRATVGVDGELSKNVSLYASLSQEEGGDNYHNTYGTLGVKATF